MSSHIFLSLILPKHQTRRQVLCIMVHLCTCDTLPLDNFKTHLHPALLYITWGLIWDSKIKRKGITKVINQKEGDCSWEN